MPFPERDSIQITVSPSRTHTSDSDDLTRDATANASTAAGDAADAAVRGGRRPVAAVRGGRRSSGAFSPDHVECRCALRAEPDRRNTTWRTPTGARSRGSSSGRRPLSAALAALTRCRCVRRRLVITSNQKTKIGGSCAAKHRLYVASVCQ
jgi:hypothetical protein